MSVFLLYPVWISMSIVCAPFFILYVAARNVYYKFRHRRATKKNLFRRHLQKSEYLWGISRTAEAGLESCGQLILQVWLVSSTFKQLSEVSFTGIIDMTYNGFIHFLSFSAKPATDVERSLGKMFMSLVALVFGVSACYRTLKRGAVQMSNTFFIYCSLLLQLFARIFSIGLYFFAVRSFFPAVPILLAIHFSAVFAIKWSFERARHTHGMLAWLVSFVNIFASSLVYVRIVPIEKSSAYYKQKCPQRSSHQVQQHSTFFVQSLFFLLVLIENVALASTPFFVGQHTNRALACLGRETLTKYVFIVVSLCAASWVCHVMYYKYMGHPWTDINGPYCGQDSFKFFFHFCGRERLFDWTWGGDARNVDPGARVSLKDRMGRLLRGCSQCQLNCKAVDECEEAELPLM